MLATHPTTSATAATTAISTATSVTAIYRSGQVITLKVVLTTNHGGKFSFRICPRPGAGPRQANLTESCFGNNYLTRADNGQRDTWIMAMDTNFTMRYRLPSNLTCVGGCVLQWCGTKAAVSVMPFLQVQRCAWPHGATVHTTAPSPVTCRCVTPCAARSYFSMQSCVEPGCDRRCVSERVKCWVTACTAPLAYLARVVVQHYGAQAYSQSVHYWQLRHHLYRLQFPLLSCTPSPPGFAVPMPIATTRSTGQTLAAVVCHQMRLQNFSTTAVRLRWLKGAVLISLPASSPRVSHACLPHV